MNLVDKLSLIPVHWRLKMNLPWILAGAGPEMDMLCKVGAMEVAIVNIVEPGPLDHMQYYMGDKVKLVEVLMVVFLLYYNLLDIQPLQIK